MKGDFSRNTFSATKNYRSVRMQQGRVMLDADWNEMVDTTNYQHTTALRNLIGTHGGLGDGFRVTFAQSETTCKVDGEAEKQRKIPELFLNAGQYYANGYACVLSDTILFEDQPFFPGAADHIKAGLANKDAAGWLLYLDVWERHLTTIEDPDLAEPALGGPDTTTRTQMIWQVKMLGLHSQPKHHKAVSELPEWQNLVHGENHAIRLNQGYATENELFRIEIHNGAEENPPESGYSGEANSGGTKPASWKWSRDNASIAFALQGIRQVENSAGVKDHHALELTLAADQRLQERLHNGDCVELDCDDWVLDGRPGWLGKVSQIESPDENGQQRLVITVSQPVTGNNDLSQLRNLEKHPLLRRWDQQATHDKEESDTTAFTVKSVFPLNRSTLEILVENGPAPLYLKDWVDLTGITAEGEWQVGQVRAISPVGEDQKIQVALSRPLPDEIPNEKLQQGVEMRRWVDEALPLNPGESLALEHGITIQFPPGTYRSGDYWLFPMRSGANTTREFTVPQVDPVRTCVPLALLKRSGSQWELVDFRRVFQDLGDVFTRLEHLQAELEKTKAWLAALQVETDIEDEEQEVEIRALQEEVSEVDTRVENLPILNIQQTLGKYRSRDKLEPGDVVAISLRDENFVVKASRKLPPAGVVAPRPDDFEENEYSVVLSGPVNCRIHGRVRAGDLLAPARRPGVLEKASLWVRWFESEKIVARAIDIPTSPNDLYINVYFMPDYKKEGD